MLYSYHGQDENDLSVERGQLVTVLNKVNTADVSPLSLSRLYYFLLMNVSAGWPGSERPPAI